MGGATCTVRACGTSIRTLTSSPRRRFSVGRAETLDRLQRITTEQLQNSRGQKSLAVLTDGPPPRLARLSRASIRTCLSSIGCQKT